MPRTKQTERKALKKTKVEPEAKIDPAYVLHDYQAGMTNFNLKFPLRSPVEIIKNFDLDWEEVMINDSFILDWDLVKPLLQNEDEGEDWDQFLHGDALQLLDYRRCNYYYFYFHDALKKYLLIPEQGEFGGVLPPHMQNAPSRLNAPEDECQDFYLDVPRLDSESKNKFYLDEAQPRPAGEEDLVLSPTGWMPKDQSDITFCLWPEWAEAYNARVTKMQQFTELIVWQHLGRPLGLSRDLSNEISKWVGPFPVPLSAIENEAKEEAARQEVNEEAGNEKTNED